MTCVSKFLIFPGKVKELLQLLVDILRECTDLVCLVSPAGLYSCSPKNPSRAGGFNGARILSHPRVNAYGKCPIAAAITKATEVLG